MSAEEPDLWFSFVRAHRLMISEIERRLAAQGLPEYAWYDTLWGVESGQEGMRRMHELADVLAIARYNLTRIVDRLEAEGLVVRSRPPEDRRATHVTITKQGRALRKKMWKVYEAAVSELFLAQFTAGERRALSGALDRAGSAARSSRSVGERQS
jgi:DNA-binding MarR family transcriptional regulator